MKRNVFLSFTMEDRELADLFRNQMENRQPGLGVRDYSIKEAFEHAWKTKAERLIRACSATICLIGKTTHRSRAVDWEVRKSEELSKHIMAVSIEPTGPIVPSALAELKVKPLSWNMERIADELNGSSGFRVGRVEGKGERQGSGRHSRESGNPPSNRCIVMPPWGRKDGNTESFHKNGWIPAFAGMTGERASAEMMRWGVLGAKPRTT